MLGHNRSPGDDYADAIKAAAAAKVTALRAEKLWKRMRQRTYLSQTGPVEERKAKADTDPKVVALEDEAIEAESAHILAGAESDSAQVRWETWRTNQANDRAAMNLR